MRNKYSALVLRVIDGDTFEALVHLGFGVEQRFRVRLDGIDTPEIYGENKKEGLKAKRIVRNMIEGKVVNLYEAEQKDKFGRALANVELEDGRDLTNVLIEEGLGKEYHGEAKKLCSLSIID